MKNSIQLIKRANVLIKKVNKMLDVLFVKHKTAEVKKNAKR